MIRGKLEHRFAAPAQIRDGIVQGLSLSIVSNPTGVPPNRKTTRAALDALFGALFGRQSD